MQEPIPPTHPLVAEMVATLDPNLREAWEERAAIVEFEAQVPRAQAESLALLDILRRNPKTPADITILRIQWEGTTSWLLSTDLSFAKKHLAGIKDVEISIIVDVESDLTVIA